MKREEEKKTFKSVFYATLFYALICIILCYVFEIINHTCCSLTK
jgi:preprotein translocase subunit SecE